ncbi:hypothetical protein [Streptomyces flaveus]|uniref:hypothetical protein n=1 Tax=Streptomyces flaveus TaxID=66370 RepID=UPI0033285173
MSSSSPSTAAGSVGKWAKPITGTTGPALDGVRPAGGDGAIGDKLRDGVVQGRPGQPAEAEQPAPAE